MNLNPEYHFSQAPLSVDLPRSKFDRSHGWKGSTVAGNLNCFLCDEILPGDTVDLRSCLMSRMTTPYYPVMDDCYIDQYFFFVPMRLVWDHTKQFFGENDTNAWIPETEYIIPQIRIDTNRDTGDFAHQVGLPLSVLPGQKVNALPFRAYRLIWNEWFRDQNLQSPKLINKGDTENDTTYMSLLPVNRVHDLFGSCLPGQQKGTSPVLNFGAIPVFSQSTRHSVDPVSSTAIKPLTFSASISGGSPSPVTSLSYNLGMINGQLTPVSGSVTSQNIVISPDNLYAIPQGSGISVSDLRTAMQTQKILEQLARTGSRYVEYIKGMFGVDSPDARLQRPELLGHSRHHVNMQEVTQSSPAMTNSTPLGTVGAYSKSIDNGLAFSKSFTEHGYLIGLFCIRHNRSYSQGIGKQWTRQTVWDFYNPKLAHISEVPVHTSELFADTSANDIFGFQEAWYEYRYKPSINCGLLDPSVPNTIGDVWTYGDKYDIPPILSDLWLQEGSTEIARTLAVTDEDQFIHDAYFDYKISRVMPVYSVPGLVDHF
ncbi:major capsid protein [Capybara microvirus Cap1_SP_128]|nr:major capsid protein [Capybara microvirus Cap1_SP_128]